MKVAVIADIHGNYHGLEAILHDIEAERAEMIAVAGDIAGCSPHSSGRKVLEKLSRLRIPMLRGNHEEYILAYHDPNPNSLIKESVQFMPTQYIAKQFSSDELELMRQFPMTLTIEGPGGDNLLLCHASPSQLSWSYAWGIDERLEDVLQSMPVSTIVGAHTHNPWHRYWQGKLLLVAGSGGLPLNGVPESEYLLLEHQRGRWTFRHKRVPYDAPAALQELLDGDFVKEAGPIGWLLLDEVLTHQHVLLPFFRSCCSDSKPETLKEWEALAKSYLRQTGRWDTISGYLSEYGVS